MRAPHSLRVPLAAAALVLGGCAVPSAESKDEPAVPAPELTFAYRADGGSGYVDQVLTIANTGAVAATPSFDIIPLDATGEQVRGIRVESAFGTDHGGQVVPAYTEVIDILRFEGEDAADVADVRVEEVEPDPFAADVPPANDLRVTRYDVSGSTEDERTLGKVELTNTYDAWVKVRIVGLEYAGDERGTQQFTQVTDLTGPISIAPGRTASKAVAAGDQGRFYGSVRAYLVR